MTAIFTTQQSRPSYHNGFARHAAESAYPGLWKGLVHSWVPALGVTGDALLDHAPGGKDNGVLKSSGAGQPSWQVKGGQIALEFDGDDEYIETPYNPNLDGLTVCTTSTWLMYYAHENYNVLYSNAAGGLEAYSGAAEDSMDAFGPQHEQTSGVWSFQQYAVVNEWTNLVIIDDNDNIRAYANGNYMGAATAANSVPSGDLDIGARKNGSLALNGSIASFCIWDRALTPNEVKVLAGDILAPFRLRRRVLWSVPAAAGGLGIPIASYHHQHNIGAGV